MKTLYSRETPKLLGGMRDKLHVTVGDHTCRMTPELVGGG